MPADESALLEALVANERIATWLEVAQYDTALTRKKSAVRELCKTVLSKDTYAEEAERAGAVPILTQVLKSITKASVVEPDGHDHEELEELTELVAAAAAQCHGNLGRGKRTKEYVYGPHTVSILEGALGDGLGARIWAIAHVANMELVDNPSVVAGKEVLELGAGTGITGCLIAQLGPKVVVMTDVEQSVLDILADNVASNAPEGAKAEPSAERAPEGTEPTPDGFDPEDFDPEEFDPEDADSVDDLDFAAMASAGGDAEGRRAEVGNMQIRHLDWQESVNVVDGKSLPLAPATTYPLVPIDRKFEVVIAADVIYESQHARMVAATIKHRLAPHGKAMVTMTVRHKEMYDAFTQHAARHGLELAQIDTTLSEHDAVRRANCDDYEGLKIIYLQHADAPAKDWGREDLVFA